MSLVQKATLPCLRYTGIESFQFDSICKDHAIFFATSGPSPHWFLSTL